MERVNGKCLEHAIDELTLEFGKIGLTVNQTKTNIVNFNYAKTIVSTRISPITECKFLGITLDENFKWNKHINELKLKLNSSYFVIRRFSKLDLNLALLAYNALFLSRLTYGIEVWGSCSTYLFMSLFKLQKRVIRSIKKIPIRESCKSAFRELELLTLPSLYVYKVVLYAREVVDSEDAVLNSCIHSHNTRKKADLKVNSKRTDLYSGAPCNKAVEYYNCLPLDFKKLKKPAFKSRLHSHFKGEIHYSIDEAVSSLKSVK